MGVFDKMVDQVKGAVGEQTAGAGLGALGIDPSHAGLAQAVIGMLGDEKSGGLAGLQQKFQAAGLGDVIGSWIGTGPNQPIGASQLEGVLGPQMLQGLAQKAGLSVQQVGPILATLLPTLINKLTPQGQVGGGLLEAGLALLRGKA